VGGGVCVWGGVGGGEGGGGGGAGRWCILGGVGEGGWGWFVAKEEPVGKNYYLETRKAGTLPSMH